jgi:hypothetical protein
MTDRDAPIDSHTTGSHRAEDTFELLSRSSRKSARMNRPQTKVAMLEDIYDLLMQARVKEREIIGDQEKVDVGTRPAESCQCWKRGWVINHDFGKDLAVPQRSVKISEVCHGFRSPRQTQPCTARPRLSILILRDPLPPRSTL